MRLVTGFAGAILQMYTWIVNPSLARYYAAESWIKRAYRKKQWSRAESLCHEYLAQAERMPKPDWNYGNAIHNGNQFLGLIRLQQGDIEASKQYLLAAGLSTGSPVLNSYGPKMILARELLERGELLVVSEYLDHIAQFWATDKPIYPKSSSYSEFIGEHKRLIQEWKLDIEQGRIPTHGLWHEKL